MDIPKPNNLSLRHIGRNIRLLRQHDKITQREFASWLGISRPGLSQIELGMKPVRLETLWAIAQIFHVKLETFFEGPTTATELSAYHSLCG